MFCKFCGSDRQRDFNSEVAIHFPGFEGLDKPVVLVFPKVTVCLDCGFTEFQIETQQLAALDGGAGAATRPKIAP
jgi:hypothetical protein